MEGVSDRGAASALLAPVLFAALVVGTVAALIATQQARRVSVVLDLVQATDVFTPDRDGRDDRARIRFRSRRPAEDAAVRIIDRDGDVVRTLLDGEPLAGGDKRYVFGWGGRTDAGGPAPAGTYRIQILIREDDREIVPEERIRLTR